MPDEILQGLSGYITTSILKQPSHQLTGDTVLISSGLIDLFSLVDLAMFIEETYHVRLHDTELNVQTFDTLDQLSALVADRQKSKRK